MAIEDQISREVERSTYERQSMLAEDLASKLRERLDSDRLNMVLEDNSALRFRYREWASATARSFVSEKALKVSEMQTMEREEWWSKAREEKDRNELRYRLKLLLADRLGMYFEDLESRKFETQMAQELAASQLHET